TNIWPTYKYNSKTGKLETTEPKFTNNAGTYALRPSFRTDIDNMYICTAYAKEGLDIFSMESACRVGKGVAHDINSILPNSSIIHRPPLFSIFRSIDDVMYQNNLPNIGPVLIILII